MTFLQLMRAMDGPFPFRGMRRVAVIGAGDSGRTAVEALSGQGPTTRWSVASLDYPETIVWYGLKSVFTRGDWERCNRSRYRGIGRLLPKGLPELDGSARLVPKEARATEVSLGFDCAYVNELPYDCAVICAGFGDGIEGSRLDRRTDVFRVRGRPVGQWERGSEFYTVGPAAQIPIDDTEALSTPGLNAVPENSTALFRYAGRTAALADYLEKPTDRSKGVLNPFVGTVELGQTATNIAEEITVTLR